MAMSHEDKLLASLPSHWVRVNGCQIHYRAAGRGKTPVVLIHGLTVSGKYLLPTAAELMDEFTVYVPDLPGFGSSEKPRQVLDIPEMAEVLRAWMDVTGLERAYLLGNSLGCHIVIVLAVQHRERVAGTILVSPVGDPGVRNTLRLLVRALNDYFGEPRSLWAIMFLDFLRAGLSRTLRTLRNLQQCRLEAWLPRADVPTLVVRGGRDRIVPAWWVERVSTLLPQARVAVIRGAAHVPNFSHPAQLAALVREFIESTEDESTQTNAG